MCSTVNYTEHPTYASSITVTITMPGVYECVLTLLEGIVQIKLYAIFQ